MSVALETVKNKSLANIFLIVFIDLLGFSLILPLLPYIAEKFQASPLQIGLLTSVYSLFQFISSPILGRLSDKYGRKKLLMISQFGSAVGFFLLGIANNLQLLFLSRIIDGITGGNISIAQAYIADVTSKKDRAKGMGLIGAAFGLGFIFGPAIGGLLSNISFSLPAYFACLLALITVATTYLTLKETVSTNQDSNLKTEKNFWLHLKSVLTQPTLIILIISFFILNTAFSIHTGIFPLWTEKTFHLTPSENGWFFTYIGILAVIFQTQLLPYATNKLKEKNILYFALLAMSTGLVLIPLTKTPWQLLIPLFFLPLGNGLANPTIQALASENTDQSEYGQTLGVLQSAGSLGRILGPIIAGEAFQTLGQNTPFYLASGLIFANLIFLKLQLNKTDKLRQVKL